MKQSKVLMLNSLGIGCCSTSKMAAQSCLQGFNQQIFFFSILIGGLDISLAKNIINLTYLDIGVAKNTQGVLCKWMPQDKYFKYQNFPTYILLSLFLEFFGEI